MRDILFNLDGHVLFYNHREDKVSIVGEGRVSHEPAVLSPDYTKAAVLYSSLSPNVPAPLTILDVTTGAALSIDMTTVETQQFWGIADVRWLSNQRLLIGIDYNLYVRGYYIYDVEQEAFTSTKPVLTKAGDGVIESLDTTGSRFMYQYPNERSFGIQEKPAIYIDHEIVYEADQAQSVIGRITVDTTHHLFGFTVMNEDAASLLLGVYNEQTGEVTGRKRYPLKLQQQDRLLGVAVDLTTGRGYALVTHEADGTRSLYSLDVERTPVLESVGIIPDSLSVRSVLLEESKLIIINNEHERFQWNAATHSYEAIVVDQEVINYLLERIQEDLPQLASRSPKLLRTIQVAPLPGGNMMYIGHRQAAREDNIYAPPYLPLDALAVLCSIVNSPSRAGRVVFVDFSGEIVLYLTTKFLHSATTVSPTLNNG